MRRNLILFFLITFFCIKAGAEQPSLIKSASEQEYRDALSHLKQMLPEVENKAVYSPLLRPFGLLDVVPTQLKSKDDKIAFINFNLGVMGSTLGLNKEDIALLPNSVLCNDESCIQKRITLAEKFLVDAEQALNQFAQSSEFFLVGQLSESVFRINHTFVSNSEAYTYRPSKIVGLIPSADFTHYSELTQSPELLRLIEESASLRKLMRASGIAAVVRSSNNTLNIIFNGVGDNHWGVIIGEKGLAIPSPGEFNHLGYDYDKVAAFHDNAFYYQTN
ncbi:hypothetical protein J3L16_01925 [Alteromonas sp. 5E99-2]|uniref:hypothetical protein n=1 Tax=Alteromonas sp. 5E99-2 TaxID=2817683 RepID=UPI001A9A0824|nr:hypothetical protein [Alteromonas sp. 5E99-2]MBO1254439.1 hypothetical protein [Alteromonas sp. 5E99-2]